MKPEAPEKIIRDIMRFCTNGDTCRYLLERDCVFFPELCRLWAREVEDSGNCITCEVKDSERK